MAKSTKLKKEISIEDLIEKELPTLKIIEQEPELPPKWTEDFKVTGEGLTETAFEVEKVAEKHEIKIDTLLVPKSEKITVTYEEKTEQQRILDYISNSHSDKVDLAPLLKSLYPLPSYSEPAIYLQQGESKRLRGVLIDMAAKGEVVFEDETYLKLGKNHWLDADAKTKSWNIDTLKIVAKKNS